MVRRALGFVCFCAAACVAADLPVIRLDTVFPPGGKAGMETEVTVTGALLDEAKALHFSHPGITGEAKDKRFIVKVAPDVPPGIYDVRVTGVLGISNPRAFIVSDLPQAAKSGANNTPDAAIELPLDSVIAGSTTAATADFFNIAAKKGQRVLVQCEAAAIDSRLTPVLAVLDKDGRELGASRRAGLLDFSAPYDGTYLLKLHDLTFAGGADYFYRLTATTGPRIDFIFPPCAKPGVKGKFTLYGRNLPGGVPASLAAADGRSLEKLEVEIEVPANGDTRADGLSSLSAAALNGFSWRLNSPRASNAVFIGFTQAPVVAEREPNDKPAQAQKLTPPCEVAGQFFPANDTDTFVLDAKKGDVWRIEVISHRLGLPVNPFVLIQRDSTDVQEAYAADTNIGSARCSTASNDPVLRFEAKEDGAYRIRVRDLFGSSRKDPRNIYRLAIRRESPDFSLLARVEPALEKKDDRSAAPRAALLRAGGTIAIKVLAFRRDGFGGEIELRAGELPSGASCLPLKIPAGANEGVLLLTSAAKPERWAGAIRIVGKAKIGDADVVREARGGTVRWPVADWNNEPVLARLTRDFALAVSTEAAPVTVSAAEEKCWEVTAGSKIAIPLKVTRLPEFKEALKLKAAGAPGIEAVKEIEIPANATEATATIDVASEKIPAGDHTIYFEAQTKGKFRGKDVTTTIYSAPVRIAVKPAAPK